MTVWVTIWNDLGVQRVKVFADRDAAITWARVNMREQCEGMRSDLLGGPITIGGGTITVMECEVCESVTPASTGAKPKVGLIRGKIGP